MGRGKAGKECLRLRIQGGGIRRSKSRNQESLIRKMVKRRVRSERGGSRARELA